MIYTLFNTDGTIAQSESLGSILRCVEIDLSYGQTIDDLELYVCGEVLDVGYQLAVYHIIISITRFTAKNTCKENVKAALVFLRQNFQRFYK